MKAILKTHHRNGRVFLRLVKMGLHGRESHVIALEPEESREIGEELLTLAARAQGKHKTLKVGKRWT